MIPSGAAVIGLLLLLLVFAHTCVSEHMQRFIYLFILFLCTSGCACAHFGVATVAKKKSETVRKGCFLEKKKKKR